MLNLSLWIGFSSLLLFGVLRFGGSFGNICLVAGNGWIDFFVTHLYLYRVMGLLPGSDIALIQMYPFWILGLLILFPLCWQYGKYKYNRLLNTLARFFDIRL